MSLDQFTVKDSNPCQEKDETRKNSNIVSPEFLLRLSGSAKRYR